MNPKEFVHNTISTTIHSRSLPLMYYVCPNMARFLKNIFNCKGWTFKKDIIKRTRILSWLGLEMRSMWLGIEIFVVGLLQSLTPYYLGQSLETLKMGHVMYQLGGVSNKRKPCQDRILYPEDI